MIGAYLFILGCISKIERKESSCSEGLNNTIVHLILFIIDGKDAGSVKTIYQRFTEIFSSLITLSLPTVLKSTE